MTLPNLDDLTGATITGFTLTDAQFRLYVQHTDGSRRTLRFPIRSAQGLSATGCIDEVPAMIGRVISDAYYDHFGAVFDSRHGGEFVDTLYVHGLRTS
jgi:hypothetical protein